MPIFLLSLLVFLISFVAGLNIGAFVDPAMPKGEISIPNLISISFTVIGGGTSLIATSLALYAYSKWKNIKRDDTKFNINIALIDDLYRTKIYASDMLNAYAYPEFLDVNETRIKLNRCITDISARDEILKTINDNEHTRKLIAQRHLIKEFAAAVLNIQLIGQETTKNTTIDEHIKINAYESIPDYVKLLFNDCKHRNKSGYFNIKELNKKISGEINSSITSLKEELKP